MKALAMLSACVGLLILLSGVLASPMANQYFDSVLNTSLRKEIGVLNLDPAIVPDFVTFFEDKVAIIGKVKGQAEFTKGTLNGLSQARRYSECQGPYYSFGSKNVNCTIGFDKLSINYNGKMKYGKMPKVSIKGKSNVTTIQLFVEVTQNPSMQPSLKNFMFTQMGQLQVKFSGLGPLNRFTKVLEDGFKGHVQAEVFNSMSQKFQFALNRAVASIPLPM